MDDAPAQGFSTLDGNYAVRKPTGVVYTGTTEEDAGFDLAPTPKARSSIEAWGRSVSSRFAAHEPFEQTACLRPLSADGLPIVGAVPGLDGAYLATGHGRKGIALAPATSQALAEAITTGKSRSLDLAPFSPGRFRGE
jgi:glycine/D-amino acid oxidase-like deaminating enzyme